MAFDDTSDSAGQLDIDLTALRYNYELCKETAGLSCTVGAAIKADAYGIGVDQAAPVLYDAGCRNFFVATLDEGLTLRKILPEPDARIAVLNGLQKGSEEIFDFQNLTPVLNSLEQIERWEKYALRTRPYLKCIVHVDTGMARLGLDKVEQKSFIERAGHYSKILDIDTIMTHFACADEEGHPLNEQQFEKFHSLTEHFPLSKKSLSNSSGLFRDPRYHFDLARPGMCLYGLNPLPEQTNPMKPVVHLNVPVLQIRTVKKGDPAGYGASWVAEKTTKLATVQLGYADGFLRSFSARGTLFWQNIPCPIIGRVSMDLTIISLENMPDGLCPAEGQMMEVIGPNQSADDIADAAGTIGYEILTSLGQRYHRRYIK
jgi:alanine racemase